MDDRLFFYLTTGGAARETLELLVSEDVQSGDVRLARTVFSGFRLIDTKLHQQLRRHDNNYSTYGRLLDDLAWPPTNHYVVPYLEIVATFESNGSSSGIRIFGLMLRTVVCFLITRLSRGHLAQTL